MNISLKDYISSVFLPKLSHHARHSGWFEQQYERLANELAAVSIENTDIDFYCWRSELNEYDNLLKSGLLSYQGEPIRVEDLRFLSDYANAFQKGFDTIDDGTSAHVVISNIPVCYPTRCLCEDCKDVQPNVMGIGRHNSNSKPCISGYRPISFDSFFGAGLLRFQRIDYESNHRELAVPERTGFQAGVMFKSILQVVERYTEFAEYFQIHNNELTMIPDNFLAHASDVLADTTHGFTWSQLVKILRAKSIEVDVNIPYASDQFPETLPNKRTGLLKNLKAFEPKQQFLMIELLCDQLGSEKALELKKLLLTRYGEHYAAEHHQLNMEQVTETKSLLTGYTQAKAPYDSALKKRMDGEYERNLLDDLRLTLELLLKNILNNTKSFENQVADLRQFQKTKGTSVELTNMFNKLLDYYSKYQNQHVKHNDQVNPEEVDFVVELTSSFMKFLIKLDKK